MTIQTIGDMKAEMARHDITQTRMAEALGISQSLLSHLFSARSLVDLTPAGAARVEDAIEAILNGVPVQGAVA